MPVTTDATSAKRSTRPSIDTSSARGELPRQQLRAGVETDARQQQTDRAPGRGEDQRLDDQLLEHAAAASAEGGADGDFLPPGQGAGEQQISDVRAGDQEDECNRGQQDDERHPDVADQHLLKRDDRRAPAGVLLRVLVFEARRDLRQLGIRLRQRDPGSQACDDLRVVVLAHRALRVGVRHRHPQVGAGRPPGGDREAGRHHSDDRVGLAVERAAFARRRRARRRNAASRIRRSA